MTVVNPTKIDTQHGSVVAPPQYVIVRSSQRPSQTKRPRSSSTKLGVTDFIMKANKLYGVPLIIPRALPGGASHFR